MTTCKHGVNKKYCKACKAFAEKMTKALYKWAQAGIESAAKLLNDIDLGRKINLSDRLDEIAQEIKDNLEEERD